MALLTTGLVDNPSVAGIRPSAALDVLLINDTLLPAAVRITGYYVSGGIKTPYVLELLALAPDAVSIRNYFPSLIFSNFNLRLPEQEWKSPFGEKTQPVISIPNTG